ncbi:MAG: hypothetical protein IK096_07345 [Lachnospiraceae bacterium]|nr:hypothetical protein [Lachnospiraceae bacterium]
MKVLDAIEKANGLNGKDKDMEPLTQIVADGMRVVTSLDMKKGALEFLGQPTTLDEDATRRVFQDPANREKLIGYMSAQYNFVCQSYQALNKPGLVGQGSPFQYSVLEYREKAPESVQKMMKDTNSAPDKVTPFITSLMGKLSESEMAAFGQSRKNADLLQGPRHLYDYISGAKPLSISNETKAIQTAMRFETVLDRVAADGKISNPALYASEMELKGIKADEIGLPQAEATIDRLVSQPLSTVQRGTLKQKLASKMPRIKTAKEYTAEALAARAPERKPKVSQTIPPEAVKPLTPQQSSAKKENPKPEPKKEDPKPEPKKEDPKPQPKKDEPKPEKTQKKDPKKETPKQDEPQTRSRSDSIHSATHAARHGRYKSAPKPPTSGGHVMGG